MVGVGAPCLDVATQQRVLLEGEVQIRERQERRVDVGEVELLAVITDGGRPEGGG